MAGSQGDVLQMWTEAQEVVVDNQQVVFLRLTTPHRNRLTLQNASGKRRDREAEKLA
jgi:hypothetical protein